MYVIMLSLTVAQEPVVDQRETESDGEQVEEIVVSCGYDQNLKKHLQQNKWLLLDHMVVKKKLATEG